MLNLPQRLSELEKKGEKIKVGVVGIGQMGAGVVSVISGVKGMEVLAVCDIEREKARQIFQEIGLKEKDIAYTDDPLEAEKFCEKDKRIFTDKTEIIPMLSFIDCIVEATGVPRVGAEVAFEAIRNKKHVIMMNLEADVTAGFILSEFAKNAGVVYTVGAGDEPAAIKELYDFAVSVGFKVVTAGKGKNNPLNREATPETLKKVAFKKGVNPKMLCEFVDGSKTMIEMSCVANATGLFPDVRGMHGPFCKLEELPKVFSLKEKGGILTREGVVDYALGKIAPGVFVVVTTDNPRIKKDLDYLGMGKGPSYLLYRPYHLTNMEIPISIARAVIYREPTIAPLLEGPVAETITIAKRDLKKGKVIDGIGGFDVYGLIEKAYIAREENLLPLGLAEGAVLKRDVKKGQCVRWDDVYIEENVLLNLRKLQDRLFPSRRE